MILNRKHENHNIDVRWLWSCWLEN